MTKTIRFGAAGVAIAAALSMTSVAQAQSADATATAEVLQALTLDLQAGTSLDFGSMVVNAGGSVSLAADGTLDCSDANIICSGTTDVAGFDVTGSAGENVRINLPASVDLLHTAWTPLSGGEHVIVLDSLVTDGTLITPGVGSPYYQVALDGVTGAASFNVGGTITMDGTEVAGVFSETFTVTVEYP